MELGERLVGAAARSLSHACSSDIVYARGVGRLQPRERAEQAARHADVGRLEPEVVVEVRARAVTLLALAVRERSDGEQVGSVEQRHAILEREAFARREASRRSRPARPRWMRVFTALLENSTCYTRRLTTDSAWEAGELGEKPGRSRHCKRCRPRLTPVAGTPLRRSGSQAVLQTAQVRKPAPKALVPFTGA